MNEILVLYYSRQGSTAALARQVCRGVETVPGMQARLRTVPALTTTVVPLEPSVPNEGPPYATHDDLAACRKVAGNEPSAYRAGCHGGAFRRSPRPDIRISGPVRSPARPSGHRRDTKRPRK